MKISNAPSNKEIAELLRDVAAALQIKDETKNKFRIIAYERAADAIEHLTSEAKDLWDEGHLKDVAGIGDNIASNLDEIFKTGKSKHFESVINEFNPGMFELMKISGIGPKTAFKISNAINITSRDTAFSKLEKAIAKGKVSAIEGLGEATQENIAKSLKEAKNRSDRLLLPYAREIADEVIAWLKTDPNVKEVEALGSLRRSVSTVGDIDIAVVSDLPEKTMKHFVNYPKSSRTIEMGPSSASIILPGSVQVDLMIQPANAYGALLAHFTGSKHHNVALREYALKKGLSLSERGIKKVGDTKGVIKKYSTEKAFYKALGMDWIPPELREDEGEIKAALEGTLPRLVELNDIKADLHMHSDFDIETSHDTGQSSMEELCLKADGFGYEYIALTEHNPSRSKHSASAIIKLLKAKQERVRQLNSYVKSNMKSLKYVFNSLEIDILANGDLAIPDEGFNYLDFGLVSVHSSFMLDREVMTNRVLAALDHPKVKIFAHPTARLLNEREGIDLDWERIFNLCQAKNKWLEINCDPKRLDLPDSLVHEAVKRGIKLTFGTDSHYKDSMDMMRYGVSVARRGWATKTDIVNTMTIDTFTKSL